MKQGCLIIVLGFLALLILGWILPSPPGAREPVSRTDEIRAGCEREFPGDTDAQRECFVTIIMRERAADNADRLDRAAR